MRVAFVHASYTAPGGEDQSFRSHASTFRAFGHEVVEVLKYNADFVEGGAAGSVPKVFWNGAFGREMKQLATEFRPDVVHFFNTFPFLSQSGQVAIGRAGIAVVQQLSNYRFACPAGTLTRDGAHCEECVGRSFAWPSIRHGCYRGSRIISGVVASSSWFHRSIGAASSVDSYIAVSPVVKDAAARSGLDERRISVIPNSLTVDPGIGHHRGGYAVFVGRLVDEKGVWWLAESWAAADGLPPLRIIGDGPLREGLTSRFGGSSKVEVIGALPMDAVLTHLRDASLLVFPSTWREPFGRVLIEALATGLPILGSSVGCSGAFGDTVSPALVRYEAGDREGLLRGAAILSSRTDEVVARREAARSLFERKFGAERVYELQLAAYELAVQRAANRRAT